MKQKRWMLVLVTVGLLILPIHMTAEENQNEPTVQEENDPPAESPETDDPEIPKDEENKPAQAGRE